jgi:hypothetical protein
LQSHRGRVGCHMWRRVGCHVWIAIPSDKSWLPHVEESWLPHATPCNMRACRTQQMQQTNKSTHVPSGLRRTRQIQHMLAS